MAEKNEQNMVCKPTNSTKYALQWPVLMTLALFYGQNIEFKGKETLKNKISGDLQK